MANLTRQQTRYMSRDEFNALDKSTVPAGTEINIVDQIQKEDLSTDVLNSFTNPTWHTTAPGDTAGVLFTRLKIVSCESYPSLVNSECTTAGYATSITGTWKYDTGVFVGTITPQTTEISLSGVSMEQAVGETQITTSFISATGVTATYTIQYLY